jgi:hypothetical protein
MVIDSTYESFARWGGSEVDDRARMVAGPIISGGYSLGM